MVMFCSRSAASPSNSNEKSSASPCVPNLRELATSASSWSSKTCLEFVSSRPISVDLP